jgi:hypothetical protein
MSVEKGIYKLLSTGAATNTVATRIYPQVAPQDAAYPFAVYQRISTEPVKQVVGPLGEARASCQISFYGQDYGALRDVADAVRAQLDGYNGTPAGSGTRFNRVYWENEHDVYEQPESGGQVGVHGIQQDFAIWHDT